jgi:hypothetical protein
MIRNATVAATALCCAIATHSGHLQPTVATPVRVGAHPVETREVHDRAAGLPSDDVRYVELDAAGRPVAITSAGTVTRDSGRWTRTAATPPALAPDVRQAATAADRRTAEARASGLFARSAGGPWERLFPRAGKHAWSMADARGVAFDTAGRLWFASPQGVGCFDGRDYRLWTGADGLPYDDFTTVAAGEPGVVWFGTRRGAIRFDGTTWEYRQGPRWLPDDDVRAIAVEPSGTAWIATPRGLARIVRRSMTLAGKAEAFELEIDRRHRRTPFQFVHPVRLSRPGDLSRWTQVDSDNDGLWTSMYGAGEAYACAATKRAEACARAHQAFEALRFLGEVTQGGSHPAPAGFVARSILPADGPDPNVQDSPSRDRQRQARDRRWKVVSPRWPKSADGAWFWKSDTSSDELDGHYFFYALYHDLVPKNAAETDRLKAHVTALTDHLVAHGYRLVDHDGAPTRWGVFDPDSLNHDVDWWEERGLNSLSILTYLRVAEHVTGNAAYGRHARDLVERHGYAANALIHKTHLGAGGGNQSDDEMAFMNLYHLVRYEPDPQLRERYLLAFHHRFQNELPERNPLFNFLYAAVAHGQAFEDAFGRVDLSPSGAWLEDAVDTLRRFPIDRVNWPIANSHRIDVVPIPEHVRGSGLGARVGGKVLPIDERYVGHWNHDPWQLDYDGDGTTLGDGAPFLLPYYMGLYHGFIVE